MTAAVLLLALVECFFSIITRQAIRPGAFIVDGIDTTLPLFRTLVRNADVQNGVYDIHWLEHFLATGGIESGL